MTPEELVDAADLRYLSDVLTRDEALAILRQGGADPGGADRRSSRPRRLPRATPPRRAGSATATTSCAGCCRRRSTRATATSSSRSAPTSTTTSADCAIAREVIGRDAQPDDRREPGLGRAAGHRVGQPLAEFDPLWIEEPTSPDDILGHAADPPGRRSDRRRHRRARDEPGAVQADVPGRRRSTTASWTRPGWPASTRSSRSTSWPRSSTSRSARTPAASGCASWSSTCRSSTTSRSRARSTTGSPSTSTTCTSTSSIRAWCQTAHYVLPEPPGYSAADAGARWPRTPTRTAPTGVAAVASGSSSA